MEVPEDEKIEHKADRLGHPETLLTPLESLLRVDRVLTHPTFKNLAFVKLPPTVPDDDVDFTKGDIIYENSNAFNW